MLHKQRLMMIKTRTFDMHDVIAMKAVFLSYTFVLIVVGACTAISFVSAPYVDRSNLIMIYVLGLIIIAMCQSDFKGSALLAALLSALAFDFFFTVPQFNFSIKHWDDLLTLLVMSVLAQVISRLTSRMRRHSEATRQAQMLAETERFRNILLMSISHDLRTPLTVIMGSASSLLQARAKLSNAMQDELIEQIYYESTHLNQLVTNVLQLIRLESAPIQLNREPHMMEEVLGAALNKIHAATKHKHITIDMASGMPLIPLDTHLIEQVFINLIENSLKYTPPDSPITISVGYFPGKNILVTLTDEGPGIQPDETEKIFDKFYQGQNPESNGVGIGLALCKSVIQAHGGRIWAANRPQGGASFHFTLPLV